MRYAGEKKLNIWVAMALGILALFLLFVVYPLVLVLYKSVLSEDGNLSFAYFTKFFARKYYWSTLVNSFKVTIVSTVVAAVLGLAMAYVLRSVQIKGSKYLNILIVISYLSPPFIGAYAWIQLLGRNGFFTKILNSLFHIKLGGIYGFAGIVLVFSLQSFPLVYMYISGALKNLDNSLNEAAESLGCTAFQRVMQIIVPLVMPTMLASSLLVFMRVFSDFGTPMLIGEGYKTFPVLIYSQFMGEVSTDDHFAAALCVIVIGITLVLFFLQRYLGSRFTYSMTALKPMVAENAPAPAISCPICLCTQWCSSPSCPRLQSSSPPSWQQAEEPYTQEAFPWKTTGIPCSPRTITQLFSTPTCSEYAPLPLWWCSVSSYPT